MIDFQINFQADAHDIEEKKNLTIFLQTNLVHPFYLTFKLIERYQLKAWSRYKS